jgi:hypothetical protein
MIATYISANSFKVSGNKTGEFVVDRRIKADCGDDGEVIATIVSSSYNGTSSETTVVIDETGLTSNLIGVLYGVVAPGATGSMPIHPHDGSEGSGGSVGGGGSSTFLGLTDTPSSFDDGKYLKSTVSGTEWATVSGGAAPGDYVEYDFGSRTISGTGDIHCNDIYTSSGTVYIGGLKLSSPDGTNLYLNDTQTAISGSDGADGADGNTWTVASGTPVGVANTVGDMYLDDSNYDIYQATSLSGTVVYGTTDLCTGGTANASAIYSAGYEAYRAFDDNTGTWWNSPAGAGPHWIGYELTSARPAGKVTILHYSTGIYANEWKFQGTNDTESDWDSKVWVDLGTVTYSSAPSGVQTHEFGNQVAYKYYRLISVTVIGNEWPVREIEFFESLISDVYELVGNIKGADGQDFSGSATLSGLADTPSGYDDGKYLRSTSGGTEWSENSHTIIDSGVPLGTTGEVDNIYIDSDTGGIYKKVQEPGYSPDRCVGGTATSSQSHSSFPITNAFDNNVSTFFSSGPSSFPLYVQYQFTSAVAISKLRMYTRIGSYTLRMPKDFVFKGSNTGAFSGEETNIATYSSQTYTTGWE